MDEREREFHFAMVAIYETAKIELGYVATRFAQMLAEHGGVATARHLLRGSPSEGFTTLWERQRLDLSVEYHVCQPRFQPLFTTAERRTARRRLEAYGFDVDARRAS